jgi:preprotein translocase subunit YajC
VFKSKIRSLGLLAALLFGLLALSGCIATPPGDTQNTGGFNWTAVIMVVALIALFYFFIMRPQSKRRKEQQQLMSNLKAGDHVIAAGGIYGEIESVGDDSLIIKVESGAKIRVSKQGLMVRHSPDGAS